MPMDYPLFNGSMYLLLVTTYVHVYRSLFCKVIRPRPRYSYNTRIPYYKMKAQLSSIVDHH